MPFHSFSPGCYARYWSTEDIQQSLSMSVNVFVERFSLSTNGLVWQLMVVQTREHQLDQSSQSSQRSQLNHLLTLSRLPLQWPLVSLTTMHLKREPHAPWDHTHKASHSISYLLKPSKPIALTESSSWGDYQNRGQSPDPTHLRSHHRCISSTGPYHCLIISLLFCLYMLY